MPLDWTAVVKIAVLDLTLSVNNAAAAAPACAALPRALRWHAMIVGALGATAVRVAMLAVVAFLLGFPALRIVAGIYLLFAGYRLLAGDRAQSRTVHGSVTVLGAALSILLADASLSLDNVLAVAAAAHQLPSNGMFYAVAGVAFSIPIVMFGAGLLAAVLGPFPIVMWLGGALIGWVAMEVALSDPLLDHANAWLTTLSFTPFTGLVGALIVVAAAMVTRRGARALPATVPTEPGTTE